jgi:hypothetical protein
MKEKGHHKGNVFKAYLFDKSSSDEARASKRQQKASKSEPVQSMGGASL